MLTDIDLFSLSSSVRRNSVLRWWLSTHKVKTISVNIPRSYWLTHCYAHTSLQCFQGTASHTEVQCAPSGSRQQNAAGSANQVWYANRLTWVQRLCTLSVRSGCCIRLPLAPSWTQSRIYPEAVSAKCLQQGGSACQPVPSSVIVVFLLFNPLGDVYWVHHPRFGVTHMSVSNVSVNMPNKLTGFWGEPLGGNLVCFVPGNLWREDKCLSQGRISREQEAPLQGHRC